MGGEFEAKLHLSLNVPITTAADEKICANFLNFKGMIFYENRL